MSAVLRGIKKPLLITLTLLVICGFAYPLLNDGNQPDLFPASGGRQPRVGRGPDSAWRALSHFRIFCVIM